MMNKTAPTVETTREYVLIKIPRRLFSGHLSQEKLSALEQGLRESMQEAGAGKLYGPFRSRRAFLRALKKPMR